MFPPTTEQEAIRKTFRYNPDTGVIYRPPRGKAGSRGKDGYIRIMFNYRMYTSQQIAWFLYYGEWPRLLVDHRDRNPSNNKINNLRLATYSLNAFNSKKRSDNKSGYTGVCWATKDKKWKVSLGKECLGYFTELELALQTRKEAENAHPHL